MAKNQIIVTPPAKCLWARVQQPDRAFVNDGDPGNYSITLVLESDNEEHQALLERLEAAWDEGLRACSSGSKEAKAFPKRWRAELDPDTGDPTGNMLLTVKQREYIVSNSSGERINMKPVVVDGAKAPVSATPGNGSTVRVRMELNPVFVRTTQKFTLALRLKGVQVLDLVEYEAGPDFDEVEGAYQAAAAKDSGSAESDQEDF